MKALRVARFLPWLGGLATVSGGFILRRTLPAKSPEEPQNIFCDVAVIGGGVVGLSVARFCAVQGASVVLLEKEDTVAAGVSSGNSGLGCTGYDAPVGSLERKLLRRSIQLHPHLYRSFGLSGDHVRKCGSLVVAWTLEQLQQLPHVLAENREAGDSDAYFMDQEELRKFEPGLSPEALGAVYCPHEAIVEPWLVPMGYAESAKIHGAKILTNAAVTSAKFNPLSHRWILGIKATTGYTSLGRSAPGHILTQNANSSRFSEQEAPNVHAKIVINCGGLFGDIVEKFRDPSPPPETNDFHITPRKGQFIVFKPKDSSTLPSPDAIIEPVATQFTKGVIAWTTLYGNIIVGPTAVDQISRTDRSTDPTTIEELRKWGEKIIPAVRDAQVIGTYSGLRPATQYRDYQIQSFPDQKWISVNGIRSTGLTCSPGIGEYVSELVIAIQKPGYKPWAEQTAEGVNLLGVNDAKENLIPVPSHCKPNPKVPSLTELSVDYQKHGDGTVGLYSSRYRVTHPLSSFGMESFTTIDE